MEIRNCFRMLSFKKSNKIYQITVRIMYLNYFFDIYIYLLQSSEGFRSSETLPIGASAKAASLSPPQTPYRIHFAFHN